MLVYIMVSFFPYSAFLYIHLSNLLSAVRITIFFLSRYLSAFSLSFLTSLAEILFERNTSPQDESCHCVVLNRYDFRTSLELNKVIL